MYETEVTYSVAEASDLSYLQLCPNLNIREHSVSFFELFNDIVVFLKKVDMLLASLLDSDISQYSQAQLYSGFQTCLIIRSIASCAF